MKTHHMKGFTAKLTGYFPPPPEGYKDEKEAKMEGGAFDRIGKPLHTLQDHLEDPVNHPYVSVAMDKNAFPYGTQLWIPEMDSFFGKHVVFRVVDTGGAFKGKGTSRMDICVRGRQAQHDKIVNRTLGVAAAVEV